jgi:hypothetical protein
VLVLCPEHLLIHLGAHTLDELDNAPFLKIVNLAQVLTRLPVDWNLFLQEAAAFQVQGPMLWILREMAPLCPGTIPGYVLKELAANQPVGLERLILQRSAAVFPVAMALSLWRPFPVRAWYPFLKGKFWPDSTFIRANPQAFGSRID